MLEPILICHRYLSIFSSQRGQVAHGALRGHQQIAHRNYCIGGGVVVHVAPVLMVVLLTAGFTPRVIVRSW